MAVGSPRPSPPMEISSRTDLSLRSPPEATEVPALRLSGTGHLEHKPNAGQVIGGQSSPRVSEWFTPRSTPREPEPKEVNVCMVREKFESEGNPLGVTLEGALVANVEGLAARWASYFDFALKTGDIILSVGGEPFESSRALESYLKPKQRAYAVSVRRMVVPPRSALSARVYRGLVALSGGGPMKAPETQEQMEMALLEWEYFRPHFAYPELEDDDV